MRQKQKIEADILKISQAKTNIQAELTRLQEKESAALAQAGEDMLVGKEGQSTQTLTDLRNKMEGYNAAHEAASRKLRELTLEMNEFELAERVQHWSKFEIQFWTGIEELREMIGENGLNGKLYNLKALVIAEEQTGIARTISQEANIMLDKFTSIHYILLPELNKAQANLDGLISSLHPKSRVK